MVLAINKNVLDQIYNNNKMKLCEIRIRLMGVDVDLNHVVDHPRGSALFQTYLDKVRLDSFKLYMYPCFLFR